MEKKDIPHLTTLCYLEQDGKYLMLHRMKKENDLNHGKWIGVGGHFKEGESPEECLLREVKEETGLQLTDYCLRGIITFVSDEWGCEYMHLYTADGFTGELTPCNEGTLEWISKENVMDLKLWEGDRIFLRLLLEQRAYFSLKLVYQGEELVQAFLWKDGERMKIIDKHMTESGLQQRKGIKGAIFDVDGTLLDSMGIWRDVGAGYLRLRGREPEKNLNDKLFTMELMGGAAFLKQHYELTETPEEIVEGMIQIVRGRYEREVPLKAGVRELLELFSKQQIPMAAATSSDRSCIEAAFRRLGISNYIPKIFTCREVGTAKTSPVIYEKAREYLGTEREETYVFEDALHALKTVKKTGFVAVGVYEAANEKWQSEIEQSSDIYLKSMKEFEKYL